jgi:hypothetical protein
MRTMTTTVRPRMGFALAAAILLLGMGSSAEATRRQTCGPNEQTRLETRPCPDMRPGVTRTRACCTRTVHNGVRTRCKSWPRCPRPSR